MITTHFSFLRLPFGKDLPTATLYLTAHHRHVLARLEQIVARGSHAALTGEVGVGKSTLLRALFDRLPASKTRHFYVSSNLPSRGILRAIAQDLGLSPYWQRADLIAQVQQAIAEQFDKAGKRTLLAIDECHLIPVSVLDDLRLLTNFQADSKPILSLLLVGQPPLRQRLKLKAAEALKQRLEADLTLDPLGRQEVTEYLHHHLSQAGQTGPIFSGAAEEMLFDESQGIPRKLNQLALQALELAAERDEKVVDERLIELALTLN
jgi:type II secretory pathway predicted ATPase ExeA